MEKPFTITQLAGRGLRISTPGISLGALALAPYLLGMGSDAAASLAGVLAWAVPIAVSLALLVLAIDDLQDGVGSAYAHGARSYVTFAALNLAASVLAYAAFWVIVSGAASILAAPASGPLAKTMASGLSSFAWAIIVVMSLAGGVAVTAWADSRTGE